MASTIFYPPNEKQALLLPHPTHSEPSDMNPIPHSASAEVHYHLVVASVNTEVAAQSPTLYVRGTQPRSGKPGVRSET